MATVVRSLFGKFFGRTVSEAAGFAAGVATGPVLAPVVEELRQETWMSHPTIAVEPGDAAEIVAEDVELRDWGAEEALRHGLNGERFDALTGAVLNAPGLGELYAMWRRGLIADAEFAHGLRKARLETRWDGPLEGLHDVLLTSEELANLQQQGFIAETRANSEGALQGVTEERQQLRFLASGLPPGIVEGLQMLRRGIIDDARFAEIVREGHTKTKYTDDLLQLRRALLTAHQYEEAALRGIITQAEADAGAELSGYTAEDARLIFETMGRPLNVHQLTQGLAHGATLGGTYDDVPEPYRDAIRRSNIRPEYARLAYATRYTYPSAFVLRSLVQAGDLTQAEGEEILRFIGWEPALAATVAARWAGGTGAAGDSHVSKAQTQLWGTLHRSYVAGDTDAAKAAAALGTLGVAAAIISQVLALWDAERGLVRKELTPTQLRKAWTGNVVNPATGQAYTLDEVTAELVTRGYSLADAQTFLAE